MKLVFFSSDRPEVERLSQELVAAGIRCEIHDGINSDAPMQKPLEVELWILDDADCSRAFRLCVESGAGFAKRRSQAATPDLWDETVMA
jgi:hypothetical protein